MHSLAVFAPLAGFLIAGIGGRRLGDRGSQFVTCALMGFATVMAWMTFFEILSTGAIIREPLFTWLSVGSFKVSWGFRFDMLSAVMLIIVTTVSLCVHVYSVGYMHGDEGVPRFMCYLSLFTFMMLMLVTADNLAQLFFGWEGVGLTSYLLIGYWFSKDSANEASIKAFVVNRVGDVGLVLGICLCMYAFQTLDIGLILEKAPTAVEQTFMLFGTEFSVLELTAFCLFVGAMGKSAQLGLHTWLPDAMEGPTPVSALIHAATMVTAGVFLVCRMSPLYELTPYAKSFITVVGATTAFFAGTVALTQNDIKRVIAYSTCSQLGYMFFAAGLGAYNAAMFHLFTHAFFKALLFLGAGSVIHAMSDEQDMQNMGGIYRKIPVTYGLMWIGSLALAGVPFFAGYYSKDLILASSWLTQTWYGQYALALGIFSAFLTSFYSWRLLWLTFHGQPRANEQVMAHIHESPASMMLPMGLLAIGALTSGYFPEMYGWFTHQAASFFKDVMAVPITPEQLAAVPGSLAVIAKVFGIGGIVLGIAVYGYMTNLPDTLAKNLRPLYNFSFNKWYFDELYDWLFVKRSFQFGNFLWKSGDQRTVDGFGPDGIATITQRLANRASQIQTGYIYHYAFAMGAGIAVMTLWYVFLVGR
ncbi:MAG: NADH-quinone oxidoreductase subunit L [Alphaproteobacteria bacterium]